MRFSLLALITATLWLFPTAAAAMSCPAGYQELSSAGTDFGCIETAYHDPVNLFTASDACFALGARLPHWHEYRNAFLNLSLTTPPGTQVWEWLADVGDGQNRNLAVDSNDPSYPQFSNLSPQGRSMDDLLYYRCFIPAQGHSLAFVPMGPWWLTVALLLTGVALQWKHFRRTDIS